MLTYRPEIDGLRAIAVVPVILFHAGFLKFCSGGYVGVDVFFVISGYLITSLIDLEYRDGRFSLVRFYERRCRRILPVFFVVLLISNFFAYLWMSQEALIEYAQTLMSTLVISSNFFFWSKDDGYFSRINELNPLVHTWSLAVEEQFYLFFPLLFGLLHKNRSLSIKIFASVSLVSFCLAQWGGNLDSFQTNRFLMFNQHDYAAFYLPFGRIWELLLGCLTAIIVNEENYAK